MEQPITKKKKNAGNVRISNNEKLSCNHCCSGKAINITYLSVCARLRAGGRERGLFACIHARACV